MNIKLLKTIVYSMAILLITGVIFLCVAIFYNIKEDLKTKHKCEKDNIELNGIGWAQNIELKGNNIIITSHKGGKEPQKIHIIDYCTGKIISEISILP